jgi:hypothetical protein
MPIDPGDLPTQYLRNHYAELLALAEAGDWMAFFAACPQVRHPEADWGLYDCLCWWAAMRTMLGLPTGIPAHQSIESLKSEVNRLGMLR